jgi:hypothetical protein
MQNSKEEIFEIKKWLDDHKIGYEYREYADGSIMLYVAHSFDYRPQK